MLIIIIHSLLVKKVRKTKIKIQIHNHFVVVVVFHVWYWFFFYSEIISENKFCYFSSINKTHTLLCIFKLNILRKRKNILILSCKELKINMNVWRKKNNSENKWFKNNKINFISNKRERDEKLLLALLFQ